MKSWIGAVFMGALLLVVGLLNLSLATQKINKKPFSDELKRRCPQCKVFVVMGKMLTKDNTLKDVKFVLVSDQGLEMRVERFSYGEEDIVVIYFPKGIRDVGLEEFLKGVIKWD